MLEKFTYCEALLELRPQQCPGCNSWLWHWKENMALVTTAVTRDSMTFSSVYKLSRDLDWGLVSGGENKHKNFNGRELGFRTTKSKERHSLFLQFFLNPHPHGALTHDVSAPTGAPCEGQSQDPYNQSFCGGHPSPSSPQKWMLWSRPCKETTWQENPRKEGSIRRSQTSQRVTAALRGIPELTPQWPAEALLGRDLEGLWEVPLFWMI